MKPVQSTFRLTAVLAFAAVTTAVGFCQEPQNAPRPDEPQQQQAPPAPGGWRRVTDPPPAAARNAPPANEPAPAADPGYRPLDAYGQSREPGPDDAPPEAGPPPQASRYPARSDYRASNPVPPELTLRQGSYLTVRLDQMLSSDRNHAGDGFSATLVKPLVVDGVIVAERGQTLGGRVVDAQKAGRVEGVSRLAVELIDLPLVDGQQLPIKTQFVSQRGDTSVGRDAGGIAGTTALGAATGGIVAGGLGAGVGAASGAFVGLIGVLVTRGHASVIYPESIVTFRVEKPVTISTVHAPQAFRYVDPRDYERADSLQQRAQSAPRMVAPAPYYSPYYGSPYYGPYVYGGYYPYYWGPGYWGPSIGFYYGRGYWGGGFRGRRR